MKILDKEEFRVKLEEINHLVEQKDYKGAMNVVDSIDWRRVKNVRTLCVVGEIYAANKRYEDSKEIFLLASSITVVELFTTAQQIAARTYEPFALYCEAAVIYLMICTVLTWIQNYFEKKLVWNTPAPVKG